MFIKQPHVQTESEHRGYPIVQSYKYLGYYINDKGTIDTHMKETAKKFNFIKWRLTGLRKVRNLKLNINLFKILIMPNIDWQQRLTTDRRKQSDNLYNY
jgi:hypothetical protein